MHDWVHFLCGTTCSVFGFICHTEFLDANGRLCFWAHFQMDPVASDKYGQWYLCLSHDMMTSSNGNIFRVTGPLCGEFTGPGEIPAQRPVTRSLNVLFDLRPNKRLSQQSWGWWFETPSWSLCGQCNGLEQSIKVFYHFRFPERCKCLNTLRPRQNRRHLADDILKRSFLNENIWILIKISLKLVPKDPIDNIPALFQIMAWCRPGDKPLP